MPQAVLLFIQELAKLVPASVAKEALAELEKLLLGGAEKEVLSLLSKVTGSKPLGNGPWGYQVSFSTIGVRVVVLYKGAPFVDALVEPGAVEPDVLAQLTKALNGVLPGLGDQVANAVPKIGSSSSEVTPVAPPSVIVPPAAG